MQTLAPGQNAALPDAASVSVTVTGRRSHVDVIALLLDAGRKADDDNGVVLFSNLSAAGGAVALDLASDTVTIEVGRLPATIETVLIVAQADGTPTVEAAGAVEALVSTGGTAAATVVLDQLPPVATLQVAEIYRRGGAWKVRALGDGYAEGLAKLLTVHGITVDDEPASAASSATPASAPAAPAAPSAQAAPASPISLEKQRIVDLRKKVEATGSISMIKSFDSAAEQLETQGLVGERAEVVLVLDVSGSSRPLFKNGAYQALVDRCLAAGLLFDDNGEIETYLFDSALHPAEPVTLATRDGWTDRALLTPKIFRGTRYSVALREIASKLQRGAATPTFVYFVTDGGNQDKRETAEIVSSMAGLPAFLKFVAVGKEESFPFLQRLDDLTGREIDNADFFAVEDPHRVDESAFFDLVMQEFRGWLADARAKGILGG